MLPVASAASKQCSTTMQLTRNGSGLTAAAPKSRRTSNVWRRCSCKRIAASAGPEAHDELITPGLSRRQLLAGVALSASLLPLPGRAEGSGGALQEYVDSQDKFSLAVPDDWLSGYGDLSPPANRFSNAAGMSRVVGFAPPGKNGVNVSVTVTNLGADYTSLGSFGNAQTFGENLVASMDRSYLLRGPAWARKGDGPPQTAKLQDAREVGGKYYISYSVNKEGEPGRVIQTVVAIGSNGFIKRFYTVNASCLESDAAQYSEVLGQVIKSFKAPPL